MAKFKKGDAVRIKESVSSNGLYGKYAGMEGTITYVNSYNYTTTVQLLSGETLSYVGYTVLERLDAPSTYSEVDELIKERDKLSDRIGEIDNLISILTTLGVPSLTKKQKQAVEILDMLGIDVSMEEINTVAAKL